LNIEKTSIVDFDLCLYDTQPSGLLGIEDEFVSSGRLDNLGTSLVSVYALINDSKNIEKQNSINIIALFDNEEVGSLSFQGADSEFFGNNLERIFNTIEREENIEKDDFLAACARSFVISCDMAHAYHPNYPEKYQSEHRPIVHGGVTIKINPQSRYATDSEGASLLKEIGKRANVPVQEFIVRQDSPCGTTIGPIIAGKLGIKTADIGVPQLAMHSIRELCGTVDLYYYRRFMEEFFASYEDVVGNIMN
jgi:aspartyl aminopeptidase